MSDRQQASLGSKISQNSMTVDTLQHAPNSRVVAGLVVGYAETERKALSYAHLPPDPLQFLVIAELGILAKWMEGKNGKDNTESKE